MKKFILFILIFGIFTAKAQRETFTDEQRPWMWWYWMGSAVDKKGLQQHISAFYKAGMGGANITATYGVKGNEEKDIAFMSKRWIDMLNYCAAEAKKNNMLLDVNISSAWPFGGPNVTHEMAAQKLSGGRLFEARSNEKVSLKVVEVSKQKIAAISAFSNDGKYLDLTFRVSVEGILNYTFPKGKWEVYGLFYQPTMQMVKRSGKGGYGLVLDHFSKQSVEKYLERFDSLFIDGRNVRAAFNDSYEVYGADYTSTFLSEFYKRRGYDFKQYLNIFFAQEVNDQHRRIVCDYRATIADLLLDNFIKPWTQWAHQHNIKTVEQAHGSPTNWLDLYAASDIPQTESFGSSNFKIPLVRVDKDYPVEVFGRPDKLMLKFASSAAHVTAKKLVSSETATWLGNHFNVALSQVKPQVDEVFVSGINHVMLTCAAYSPFELDFPGYLFYPACNFGHNSGMYDYFPDFTQYVSRCQKILQTTVSDNEVLLYYPVFDIMTEYPEEDGSKLAMFTVHNASQWFYKHDIGTVARTLRYTGIDFDYISDLQLQQCISNKNFIQTAAGTKYKAIVIPSCKRMPVKTMQALELLAKNGVNIVFAYRTPYTSPGLFNLEENNKQISDINASIKLLPNVKVTDKYVEYLQATGIRRETFGINGLEYIRKKDDNSTVYFIANQQSQFTEGWIKIPSVFSSAVCYDPLENKTGLLKSNGNEVYLQLAPGQSCFIKLFDSKKAAQLWDYFKEKQTIIITSPWKITFENGAPVIPASYTTNELQSWANAPDTMSKYFTGTARYETDFDIPAAMMNNNSFRINLGDVRETAEVFVNNFPIGRAWSVPYVVTIPKNILKPKHNKLTIKVLNLDANRMRWLDINNVKWQNYFFVDITYSAFNAALWEPVASGLLGPVKLESGD